MAYHLAPQGAVACDWGVSATQDQCEAAVQFLADQNDENPGRSLQIGSGGSCLDGSWGQVPGGCSAQSGGDWAAHFKTGTPTSAGCAHQAYQLVCTGPGVLYHLAPKGAVTCDSGTSAAQGQCEAAVQFLADQNDENPGRSLQI